MQKKIEQKLNGFKSTIFEAIEKNLAEAYKETNASVNLELKTKSDVIRSEAEDFKKTRMQQTEENIRQMLSEVTLERNLKALKLRKYMLESTVDALYDKAKNYTNTDAYKRQIKTRIDAIAEELNQTQTLTVSLNETDKSWVIAHIQQYFSGAITTTLLNKREIGGAIISLDDVHIRYNMTLKRTIDDNKENIGAKLYTLLEKMEGYDGE